MSTKKKKKHDDVEIPITPMLDMAFQLLTFFILTYHPMPSEGQFVMNLLPASANAVSVYDEKKEEKKEANDSVPAELKVLPTTLFAGEGGRLGRVLVGDNEIQGMQALTSELKTILGDPSLPFDQALIKVDPNLRYEELVKVIDVFSSLKITKISFAELGSSEG